jgi:hypothetical protein
MKVSVTALQGEKEADALDHLLDPHEESHSFPSVEKSVVVALKKRSVRASSYRDERRERLT